MDTGKPRYKRRVIFVKKTLQFKYIATVLIAMVLAAFTVGWDVYYTMGRAIIDLNHPEVFPTFARINNLMLGKLAILLVIIFVIALFVSHRFAGPIFRFERSSETVGTGDLTHRVRLRSGDELTQLQNCFNRMIENIQGKIKKDRGTVKSIVAKLSDISIRVTRKGISPAELSDISKELALINDRARQITSEFKV